MPCSKFDVSCLTDVVMCAEYEATRLWSIRQPFILEEKALTFSQSRYTFMSRSPHSWISRPSRPALLDRAG